MNATVAKYTLHLKQVSAILPFKIGIRQSSVGNAFTLIELLVVISILGLLASLLLPVLSRAKLKSYQIKCLSNIKQLSLASFMYVSDHAKHIGYDIALPGGTWRGTLLPTAQEQNMCICPSAPLPKPTPPHGQTTGYADRAWVRWTSDNKTMLYGSYGYNGWLYSGLLPIEFTNVISGFIFTQESSLQKPVLTPVFVDANWIDLWPLEIDQPSSDLYAGRPFCIRSDTMGRCTLVRHGNGNPAKAPRQMTHNQKMPGAINMGLADGHAELVRLERLWNYYWHYDWQPAVVNRR